MSSGGIAQLVAVGQLNEYLTEKPQVSFFNSTYKRHSNFSRVTDVQLIQGTPAANGMSTVKLEKRGDLLNYIYITCLDQVNSNVVSFQDWRIVIDYVELYIGGSLIDTQTAEFSELIAVDMFAQNLTMSSAGGHHNGSGTDSEFYPLRFFFNLSVTQSLPLCALYNNEVEIRIYWGDWKDKNGVDIVKPNHRLEVHANYIFLDDAERSRFQKPFEMLITQVQRTISSNTNVLDLNFNHPVKYLASSSVLTNQDLEYDNNGVYIQPTDDNINGLCSKKTRVKLQINGEDISDFKHCVPHFTSVMSYYHCPFDNGNYQTHFLYPFCIDTSRFQPTGTLNFSRIESARLITDRVPIKSPVYAVNYNILKFQNGQCGVMFAN